MPRSPGRGRAQPGPGRPRSAHWPRPKIASRSCDSAERCAPGLACFEGKCVQPPLPGFGCLERLCTDDAFCALGTDGAGYVLRMQSAAARLQDLINDLLTFARIDAKREPFQRVDLNQIASEVVSNLEARISETGGQVTFGQLPQIEANSVQIYQLFQNLIGNALKFARDNVAPHVAISARLLPAAKPNQPSMYELTVADNGIGFDEKYLDRIFTPFQRLHERGKYEGTGMGLAICRRIVEQHHGSITATSIRNQGSTFIIHLPAAQQKEEKGK